ncbi:allantoicase [Actinomadura sp. KC345]|uniref:allantoicase n=1 Tax=Actinomadura sp. KC345 TaxID=2530371 RepID=UPI00105091A8|nr:allantoicase [Actinomadura sp. KC345]TDC57504.1 allantoicase [Actinomadura sp. KC345]
MTSGFTALPDLACRDLAAGVVSANDEFFAERENLIKPGPAAFSAADFGHKGKTYDGWETRRRREPGADHAIVRLGVPGVVRGVVIDTAWFTGNHPPHASVEATGVEGYPSPEELQRATWETLVHKSPIEGDMRNAFSVTDPRRFTHVRLTIYPDGGVARFRVHGEPVPDPRLMDGTVDLAALESGGDVVACSDMFYSSPRNILLPGRSRLMGDGWENARRRDDGNDHVTVALAGRARVHRVEIDTSYYLGNAPGWASLTGMDGDARVDLLPKTRLQPDTRHHFRAAAASPVTRVRLDVYPDGGVARLRVHGSLTREARAAAMVRFLDLLPEDQAAAVLSLSGGAAPDEARALLGARPFGAADALPARVLERLLGNPSGG